MEYLKEGKEYLKEGVEVPRRGVDVPRREVGVPCGIEALQSVRQESEDTRKVVRYVWWVREMVKAWGARVRMDGVGKSGRARVGQVG